MRFKPGQEVTMRRRVKWRLLSGHDIPEPAYGEIYTVRCVSVWYSKDIISFMEFPEDAWYQADLFAPVANISELVSILKAETV